MPLCAVHETRPIFGARDRRSRHLMGAQTSTVARARYWRRREWQTAYAAPPANRITIPMSSQECDAPPAAPPTLIPWASNGSGKSAPPVAAMQRNPQFTASLPSDRRPNPLAPENYAPLWVRDDSNGRARPVATARRGLGAKNAGQPDAAEAAGERSSTAWIPQARRWIASSRRSTSRTPKLSRIWFRGGSATPP